MSIVSSSPAGEPKAILASHIKIRSATPNDQGWIAALQARAFGPGRFARAAFRVRERLPLDPEFCLLAEIDGVPVASVSMTPISLSGINGYLLGPLATDPKYRAKGAGRALVGEVTGRVLSSKKGGFVLLVGDEPYYAPLGYVQTQPNAIIFPGPVDPKRILVHSDNCAHAHELYGAIAAPVANQ